MARDTFNFPRGIACDSTGKVYMTDLSNHRVQVFTAEGKFLKMFGGMVILRVWSNDMVYVSESGNSCVSVFTSHGVFVTSFGSYGTVFFCLME